MNWNEVKRRISSEDPVFYDKATNSFSQIRKSLDNTLLCSQAKYYQDAKTTICTAPLSYDYCSENFISVDNVGIEKFAVYDGIGWRVKELGK